MYALIGKKNGPRYMRFRRNSFFCRIQEEEEEEKYGCLICDILWVGMVVSDKSGVGDYGAKPGNQE